MGRIVRAIFGLTLAATSLWAADSEGNTSAADSENRIPAADSTAVAPADTTEHFQRFSALPVVGYSEETELQYGAMLILFTKPSFKGGQTGEIDIAAYGSTRKQFQFLLVPYFYFFHDNILGWLDFRYQNWVGHYFGTSNNPDFDDYRVFDRETFSFTTLIESKFGIPSKIPFRYGITTDWTKNDVSFRKSDSEIEVPELTSGTRVGLGYHLTLDTRDNMNWSRHGFLAMYDHRFYSDALGDFGFTFQELDLRGFSEFIWNTSMAVALLWQRTDGDVPFDMQAGPDGIKRFRGVESKFFQGNQTLILQMEFRKELIWRLAGHIFFEGGKSGDYFSDLWRNQWHHSIGFGGEFALNKKEALYARGDFSWIDNKKLGLSVYVREAF